jgi:hypothetical protein
MMQIETRGRKMKGWFPFTDYEFYAYITSGVIMIAGLDYAIFGGVLVNRADWTIVQGVFWTMISYLVGHIGAGLSSFALEQTILHKVFTAPVSMILGRKQPRWFERLFKSLFAREYSALPSPTSNEILDKFAAKFNCDRDALDDPEAMFQTAFSVSQYESTSETRLNQFMNLYGLCRNTSFAFLVVTALLVWKRYCNPATIDDWLIAGSSMMAVGMFGRFLKFYSAYTRETLRTYGRKGA